MALTLSKFNALCGRSSRPAEERAGVIPPLATRPEFEARLPRRSSRPKDRLMAGERSLHTGEVVGSIPTAPTSEYHGRHCAFRVPGKRAFEARMQNDARTCALFPGKIRGIWSRSVHGEV
jgi:hypothetical protein